MTVLQPDSSPWDSAHSPTAVADKYNGHDLPYNEELLDSVQSKCVCL